MIDLVKTAGTVSGRVAVGDGAATEFFGWLELIDCLQSAAGIRTDHTSVEPDDAG